MITEVSTSHLADILGEKAGYLLDHKCNTIPKENLHLPGPDFVDRVFAMSDRSPQVLRSLQSLYDNGRLGGTGGSDHFGHGTRFLVEYIFNV